MPNASQILAALAELAHAWWGLAAFWHAYFALFAAALALKWRPSQRLAAVILAIPLVSVVAMAWLSGNPFTTVVLGAALMGTLMIGSYLPNRPISVGSAPMATVGSLMVLFGLVYPHFLEPAPLVTYLYAAPVGIVPCPTLSVMVGFSIVAGSLGSRTWGLLVSSIALFYGIFGAAHLGVTLDWSLVAGALFLAGMSWKV